MLPTEKDEQLYNCIFWNGLKMRELQYYSNNEILELSCLLIHNCKQIQVNFFLCTTACTLPKTYQNRDSPGGIGKVEMCSID